MVICEMEIWREIKSFASDDSVRWIDDRRRRSEKKKIKLRINSHEKWPAQLKTLETIEKSMDCRPSLKKRRKKKYLHKSQLRCVFPPFILCEWFFFRDRLQLTVIKT